MKRMLILAAMLIGTASFAAAAGASEYPPSLTFDPSPATVGQPVDVTACGINGGSASVTITGPSGTFTYKHTLTHACIWFSYTFTQPGTYTGTVLDHRGHLVISATEDVS